MSKLLIKNNPGETRAACDVRHHVVLISLCSRAVQTCHLHKIRSLWSGKREGMRETEGVREAEGEGRATISFLTHTQLTKPIPPVGICYTSLPDSHWPCIVLFCHILSLWICLIYCSVLLVLSLPGSRTPTWPTIVQNNLPTDLQNSGCFFIYTNTRTHTQTYILHTQTGNCNSLRGGESNIAKSV